MGSAITKALLAHGVDVCVGNPTRPKLGTQSGAARGKFCWKVDNLNVVRGADMVIVAVKPGVVPAVLEEIAPSPGAKRAGLGAKQILISIAAGITLARLKKWSGGHKKLVRVMPNLPAQVGDGMSVWKAVGLSAGEKKSVRKLLQSFGKEIVAKNEKQIDAATAICGGGPAYVAAFLGVMAKVARGYGFSEKDSRVMALQIIDGAEDYIEETGVEFGELKKAVQTKGGTTEAGFKVLNKGKWQAVFERALKAGYKRARQLGKN